MNLNTSPIFFDHEWQNSLYNTDSILRLTFEYKGSTLESVFIIKKILGFKLLQIPNLMPFNLHFTHTEPEQSDYNAYKKEGILLSQLRKELSNYSFAQWKNSPNNLTAVPIMGNDVQCFWRQTGIIKNNRNTAYLFESLFFKTRNSIQSELNTFEIKSVSINQINELFINDKYYSKSNIDKNNLVTFLTKYIHCELLTPFGIFDDKGTLHSFALLLKDKNMMYLWLNIIQHNLVSRNANKKLLWHCIVYAMSNGFDFNFDGSINPTLDKIFRAYNPEIKPYPMFSYTSNKLIKILYDLRK